LKNMIIYLFSLLSVFPFATYYLSYLVAKKYSEDKKAKRLAKYLTIFFLIIAVKVLYKIIFPLGNGFLWVVTVIFIISLILTTLQVLVRKKIDYYRLIHGILSLTFLILQISYFVLFWLGVIKLM